MATNKAMRFFIPALFLIALGVGNIIVGHFKYEQYTEVLISLEKQNIKEEPKNLSPLQKLKYASDSTPKLIALKNKAEARRDLYQLVSFSGKIFLALSILFLIAMLSFRSRSI